MPGRPQPWYHREDALLTHVWRQLANPEPLMTPAPDELTTVAAYLRGTTTLLECDATTITLGETTAIISQQRSREEGEQGRNVNTSGGG